jgi:hypothetical protein
MTTSSRSCPSLDFPCCHSISRISADFWNENPVSEFPTLLSLKGKFQIFSDLMTVVNKAISS